MPVLLVARVGVDGAAAPTEDVIVVEGGWVGGGRGGEEGRLVGAHASQARWGSEVGAAVPLWHVGRCVRLTAGTVLVAGRVWAVVVSCALGTGRRLHRAGVNEVFVR